MEIGKAFENDIRRVILPVSDPDDIVADLCAGSGTTGIAAAQNGRRFLLADQSPTAIAVIRRRLLAARLRFDLEAPVSMAPARLALRRYPGLGFDDICLDSFVPPESWPDAISGLDGVEQWSVGRLKGDTFIALSDAIRSRSEPELNRILQVPMGLDDLAVLVVDVLGDRYCFTVN